MRPSYPFAALLAGVLLWFACPAAAQPKDAPKPPEGWVEYVPMDKVFAAWVPKGGKRTERTDTLEGKEHRIRVNLLELESEGKGKFIARTLLLQPAPAKGKIDPKKRPEFPDPKALTEAARDIFLKEVKGKVADEKEVKVGDRKAKEYSVTINAKTVARTRVLVMGRFIFQAGVVGTKEQVNGKDADLFLDSFKPTLGGK
jgi:hypothetical protein